MGNTLDQVRDQAFQDELLKLAVGAPEIGTKVLNFLKTRLRVKPGLNLGSVSRAASKSSDALIGDLGEFGRRLNPIHGIQEGWRRSSPLVGLEEKAKALGFGNATKAHEVLSRNLGTAKAEWKAQAKNPLQRLGLGLTPEMKAKREAYSAAKKLHGDFDYGAHMFHPTDPKAGKIQGAAEALSRSGWTGGGKITKYLPIGAKGQAALFSAAAIPDVVNAAQPTPTGEGGALEKGLGDIAGSGLGMIAGTGLGFLPMMGMWYGGQKAGAGMGRVLDRLRAGASLKDAVIAPSPEEAANQLQTIDQYYGQGQG